MIYLITILFTISFVIYSKFQFDDEKVGWSEAKGEWHLYGLLMRLFFFLGFLTYIFFPFDKWDFLICLGLNIIFDLGINIVLGVYLFYTGKTSKLDKLFGQSKWYMYSILLVVSILGKIFLNNKNKKDEKIS